MQITQIIIKVLMAVMLFLAVSFTVGVLVGCTPTATVQHTTIEQDRASISRGDFYFGKGQFQQAITEYSKVSQKSSLYNTAQKKIKLAKRKITEANETPIDKANNAIEDGDTATAMKILSAIPKKSPYYNQAQSMLSKLIKENAKRLADEGIDNINQGNYYTGAMQLYRAKKDDPSLASTVAPSLAKVADYLLNEGLKQHRAQLLKEAIKSWGQILDFDPDNEKAKAYYNQAIKELELLNKLKN